MTQDRPHLFVGIRLSELLKLNIGLLIIIVRDLNGLLLDTFVHRVQLAICARPSVSVEVSLRVTVFATGVVSKAEVGCGFLQEALRGVGVDEGLVGLMFASHDQFGSGVALDFLGHQFCAYDRGIVD